MFLGPLGTGDELRKRRPVMGSVKKEELWFGVRMALESESVLRYNENKAFLVLGCGPDVAAPPVLEEISRGGSRP